MRFVRAVVLVSLTVGWGCEDKCRSQCELAAGEPCRERPFESFGNLEEGRSTLQDRCDKGALWGFEAECKEGTIVLRTGNGTTSEGRFYAPSSGAFVGLTTTTDVSDETCEGKSYWPDSVPCDSPIITRVLCGDVFKVGGPGGKGITQ